MSSGSQRTLNSWLGLYPARRPSLDRPARPDVSSQLVNSEPVPVLVSPPAVTLTTSTTLAPAVIIKTPAVSKNPPVVSKTPAISKTPSAVSKTPPALSKTPSFVSKTPPAVSKTPAISKTPPAVAKPPPVVSKTPAGSKTRPVSTTPSTPQDEPLLISTSPSWVTQVVNSTKTSKPSTTAKGTPATPLKSPAPPPKPLPKSSAPPPKIKRPATSALPPPKKKKKNATTPAVVSKISAPSVDPKGQSYRAGWALSQIAQQTLEVVPKVLHELPHLDAGRVRAYFEDKSPRLDPETCPGLAPTPIRVFNDDTFDVAIRLAQSKTAASGRVAVLNNANDQVPGGGWRAGARAQEEDLFYRSTLYVSLEGGKDTVYPFKDRQGTYSPDVVIMRSGRDTGHKILWPANRPTELPVVSVLSVAAVRQPALLRKPGGGLLSATYKHRHQRNLAKAKLRIALRMAALEGHRLLVLGALGCGVFGNPPMESAKMWLEVFREEEFQGGWWEEVHFAVYDQKGEGNFEVFADILNGVEV